MKRLTFLAMAFFAVLSASAQMIAYSVSTNVVGEPGEPTVIDLQGTTGKDLSGIMIDADGNMEFNAVEGAKGFPIGFEFRYNSQKMTHFLIGTDLAVQLSPTETISTVIHTGNNRVAGFTTTGIHDVIGMFPREGVYGLEDTQISYWLEGQEGYRALVIEYKNIDFGNGGGWGTTGEMCGAKATIQYRLYEQSGNIEMKVKGMKPTEPGNYNFFRIGILGDANDFVQVQKWDGSVISARDNSVSYKADQYPVDGQVYTFVAPEACVTPTVAPADLVLTSTTTQISGTFTATQGDHFLVLATTEAELSEKPADGSKYKVGDELGNARVIANVDRAEFVGPNDMAQGTFNVFVIAYNSLCMDGPLYGNEAATAAIAMKPGAPASLAVTAADKDNITLKAEDSGAQMVIAMTAEQHFNSIGQGYTYGEFGTPAGTYEVGQEIEGGGKVIYVGSSVDAIGVNDLESGRPYFFRAWSTDGNGGYSSEYLDINAVTAAELPWELNLDAIPTGEAPLGWAKSSEDDLWSVNSRAGYFFNQVNVAAETDPNVIWLESSDIYLGEGSNWLSIDLAATAIPVRFATDWVMGDNDKVAIQVTADGVEYKDILAITKDNMPGDDGEGNAMWQNGQFYSFKVNFSEYAGQKVKVRLYIQRMSKGQVQLKNFKIDGTLYGIVGTIPGLTWDDDLFMSQDAENKNIYTATLPVTVDEVPAEAYEYKLRTNQNWDGYQLPAEGNQYWMPAEAGDYSLVFTADIAANKLTLAVERPFEVSFDNKGGWSTVYAYTWIEDGEGHVIAEPSGAWPGTPVEVSGGFFNRSWTYNFTSEQQPQFIIWNNGGGNPDWEEPADQTDDLVFVNGKKYSYYPEITSVKLSGEWNGWDGPEMTVTEYNPMAFQTTVNLIGYEADQEFKLVINGDNWIGSGELTAIEGDAADQVVEGDTGSNLTLKAGKAYDIVAFWANPSKNVKEGWLLEVVQNTEITTGVDGVRANAQHQTIYNVAGQRLQEQQRGVNIVNGKKIAVK